MLFACGIAYSHMWRKKNSFLKALSDNFQECIMDLLWLRGA
jgi:hypothetical protein